MRDWGPETYAQMILLIPLAIITLVVCVVSYGLLFWQIVNWL